MNVSQFVKKYGITSTATPTDSNPGMDDDMSGASHWVVTLEMNRGRMVVTFSQGSAYVNPPTAEDVLDCLTADASGAGQSFEDWAGDYGYDTDSRKAYKTWQAVERQSSELRDRLGDEAWEELEGIEA